MSVLDPHWDDWMVETRARIKQIRESYQEIAAREGPPGEDQTNLSPAWREWGDTYQAIKTDIYTHAAEVGVDPEQAMANVMVTDGNRRQGRLR